MRRWTAALVVVSALTVHGAAAEPQFLAQESSGQIPLTGERRVVVRGFRGEVFVRSGPDADVRFMAVDPGDRGTPRDVEVWLDAGTLWLQPPDSSDQPRLLELVVPAKLTVEVLASGIPLVAHGLHADLVVRGENLDLDLRGLTGTLSVELSGGKVAGMNLQGDVTLRGDGFEAELSGVNGFVDAVVSEATLGLQRVGGGGEVDLEGGRLVVDGMKGPLLASATQAAIQLQGLEDGAELELDSSPVALVSGKGDITIETDAEVRFSQMNAALHVNSYGGAVTGSGNEGLLEVRTDGALVQIDRNTGPMRVEGERLDVRLAEIVGELIVFASSSTVTLDRCGGEVTIENEFGDVLVRGASGHVKVTSLDGDVSLVDLSGSVDIWAETARVQVGWLAMKPDKDSRIENTRGDVSVTFPPRGGGRVEVSSKFGRIENDFAGVRVSDDGTSAVGVIRNHQRPRIVVAAEGSVSLRGSGPAKGQN